MRVKKRTKKRAVILGAAILLLMIVLAVVLSNRPRGVSGLGDLNAQQELVRGANGNSLYQMNVNETGVFYLKDGLMRYCDYETGKDVVLCDKANCLHATSSCGGYAQGMAGLAAYRGKLYALIQNSDANTYDLTEMDLNGQNRRKIASVKIGEIVPGEWYLGSAEYNSQIYYGYGKAYLALNYEHIMPETCNYGGENKTQLLVIDLDSGEETLLAESTGQGESTAAFRAISQDWVVMSVQENPEVLVGEAFQEALESGELDYLNDMLAEVPAEIAWEYWYSDPYSFYMDYARYFTTEPDFQLLTYDQHTGETAVLWSGNCTVIYDGDGRPDYWSTPYECAGWLDGDLIVLEETCDSATFQRNTVIAQWDLTEAQPRQLADLGTDRLSMMSFGTVGNYVRDGGKLICVHYLEDGEQVQTYAYDLRTGERTPLFVDSKYITFRFLGETEDSFVGEMVTGEENDVRLISKADYYAGNLDKAQFLLKLN